MRNTVSLFHWIDKEIEWRRENGLPEGFDTLRAHKPLGMFDFFAMPWCVLAWRTHEMLTNCIVAVGAEEPLEEQLMLADYFRELAL